MAEEKITNSTVDVEEIRNKIVETHKDAIEKLNALCVAMDSFDDIEVPYNEEQKEELAQLFTEIQNRRIYIAKCFATRYGGLFFI